MRCLNVGTTNQIAVLGNQHKQHLNITCSKCTLVVFNHRSKGTAIVPSRPCLLLTRLYIQMAISRATSELGYSALRPKQELAVRHILRGSDVFVSLPTGSGKSSYYCLLSRAFDFLRQRTALRESRASSRLCHEPHNFEPRRNTSGNLSALPKTSATPCFKSGKTNSLEEPNSFLRSDGRRKTSQSEQLSTLLADAIACFHFIIDIV